MGEVSTDTIVCRICEVNPTFRSDGVCYQCFAHAEAAAARRLLAILQDAEERATAHLATIESIRHGGLKILLRLANDPAGLTRLMGIENCPGLCELATELLECENETDAAGVLNSWAGR